LQVISIILIALHKLDVLRRHTAITRHRFGFSERMAREQEPTGGNAIK
jgi:hypothetical protein